MSPSTSLPTLLSIATEGGTIEDDVERRELLRLLGGGLGAAVLMPGLRHLAVRPFPLKDDALPLEAAMSITEHDRHVVDSQPAQGLLGPVLGHLHFVSELLESSHARSTQVQLAAAASEAAGFASRLAFDLNNHPAGWRYHRTAVAYAERAGNDMLRAYHLADMSLWAGILEDGKLAVQLIHGANSLIPGNASPPLQAWFAAREASAHSRVGDQSAALHALERAETLASSTADVGESTWPWTHPFGVGGADGYRGAIGARLKLPDIAVPSLQAALRTQNPVNKYRALVLGDLATSHLPTAEVEESARLVGEAFDIGAQLGSYRVLQRVREVRSYLNPYRDLAAVRDLDERMAGLRTGEN